MTVKFRSREKKISNHACKVFRELCNNKMSKNDIEAIIKKSRRYHITYICLQSGQSGVVILNPIASYLYVILSNYTSINDGEQIIAWREIDKEGKYRGLHIGTNKSFKRRTLKEKTGSIGFIVFDNWIKQQSFLKSLANNDIN